MNYLSDALIFKNIKKSSKNGFETYNGILAAIKKICEKGGSSTGRDPKEMPGYAMSFKIPSTERDSGKKLLMKMWLIHTQLKHADSNGCTLVYREDNGYLPPNKFVDIYTSMEAVGKKYQNLFKTVTMGQIEMAIGNAIGLVKKAANRGTVPVLFVQSFVDASIEIMKEMASDNKETAEKSNLLKEIRNLCDSEKKSANALNGANFVYDLKPLCNDKTTGETNNSLRTIKETIIEKKLNLFTVILQISKTDKPLAIGFFKKE